MTARPAWRCSYRSSPSWRRRASRGQSPQTWTGMMQRVRFGTSAGHADALGFVPRAGTPLVRVTLRLGRSTRGGHALQLRRQGRQRGGQPAHPAGSAIVAHLPTAPAHAAAIRGAPLVPERLRRPIGGAAGGSSIWSPAAPGATAYRSPSTSCRTDDNPPSGEHSGERSAFWGIWLPEQGSNLQPCG
jgi:hypothetical protein